MEEQEQNKIIQDDWEKEKNRIRQKNADYVETFNSIRGVKALKHISDFCLENNCTFDESSGRKSDFNQGARSVILEIRHWLNIDLTKLEKE